MSTLALYKIMFLLSLYFTVFVFVVKKFKCYLCILLQRNFICINNLSSSLKLKKKVQLYTEYNVITTFISKKEAFSKFDY